MTQARPPFRRTTARSIVVLLIAIAIYAVPFAQSAAKKALTVDDYTKWRSIGDQELSGDGKWVTYVLQQTNTIAAEAKQLRGNGASVVVVTSHAGGRCTTFTTPTDLSSCEPNEEIMQVARALPSGLVDVIVAGHAHSGMAHQVAGVAIIESYMGGRTFGRVDLVVDRASQRIIERKFALTPGP